MTPLDPKPPDPIHSGSQFLARLPCIRFRSLIVLYSHYQIQNSGFDYVDRTLGTRMESGVLVTAPVSGNWRMTLLDSTLSSLEAMATVFAGATGERQDKMPRSDAIHGTRPRTAAQLSLCSLSPFFSLTDFACVVDDFLSLNCVEACYASQLAKVTIVDSAPFVEFCDCGWVLKVARAGFFITMSLPYFMNWLQSSPLNCEDCNAQWSHIIPAWVGSSGWMLFTILNCNCVLMLDLLRLPGSDCILFWGKGRLGKIVPMFSLSLNCILLSIWISVLIWFLHIIFIIRAKRCSWTCDAYSVFVWIVINKVSPCITWFNTALIDELSSLNVPYPKVVFCWSCLDDESRECWQFGIRSFYAYLYMLHFQYNCSLYYLRLRYLFISLIKGNVEIPCSHSLRLSLLRQKTYPCRVQHVFCRTDLRLLCRICGLCECKLLKCMFIWVNAMPGNYWLTVICCMSGKLVECATGSVVGSGDASVEVVQPWLITPECMPQLSLWSMRMPCLAETQLLVTSLLANCLEGVFLEILFCVSAFGTPFGMVAEFNYQGAILLVTHAQLPCKECGVFGASGVSTCSTVRLCYDCLMHCFELNTHLSPLVFSIGLTVKTWHFLYWVYADDIFWSFEYCFWLCQLVDCATGRVVGSSVTSLTRVQPWPITPGCISPLAPRSMMMAILSDTHFLVTVQCQASTLFCFILSVTLWHLVCFIMSVTLWHLNPVLSYYVFTISFSMLSGFIDTHGNPLLVALLITKLSLVVGQECCQQWMDAFSSAYFPMLGRKFILFYWYRYAVKNGLLICNWVVQSVIIIVVLSCLRTLLIMIMIFMASEPIRSPDLMVPRPTIRLPTGLDTGIAKQLRMFDLVW